MNNLSSAEISSALQSLESGYAPLPASAEDTIARALRELLALREAGKETVAATMFKPVADLYEMQFADGSTMAFHTDAAKAAQWLNTCDGNKVQEYVTLERFQQSYAAPQLPAVPVRLPPEFCSDQGIVVQLEKVMAALAVNGVEYKRGATVDEKANILSDEESEEHVIRQYRTEFSPWIQCSKQVYESKKADGLEVRVLHERTQLSAVPDLSDDQVLEFLTVAFRHNEIDGDIEFDDIRLGLKMAIAAAPKTEVK